MKLAFQKFNPNRQPEWRFQRAQELASRIPDLPNGRRRPKLRYDDRQVARAAKFIWEWERIGDTAEGQERLFAREPGLTYAYLMYRHQDDFSRYMIEARILARQSNQEIAARVGTIPSTIDWYEALWFNVRDRLDSADWIIRHVMQAAAYRGIDQPTMDFTAKLVAYFGGPVAFDLVFYGLNPEDRIERVGEGTDYFNRAVDNLVRSRTTTEALRMDINRYNVTELLNVFCRLREIEHKAADQGGAKGQLERNVQEMLSELHWTVGSPKSSDDTPYAEFRRTAVELRAHEQNLAVSGQVDRVQHLQLMKFPDPPGRSDE